MRIDSVEGNRQRLDGGAMFGHCPRAVWERWCVPDARHRIELACRCLLVRSGGRTILLETGVGAFFPPRLQDRYGVTSPDHELLGGLHELGVAPEAVDVVVLSHLHFDHAGGLLTAHVANQPPRLAFPRAHVVVGAAAWERARAPHPRDRASFIPELPALLEATGRLEVVEGDHSEILGDQVAFFRSDGHTPGQLLARLETPAGPLQFLGDLAPGEPWLHLPITMGYDRYPELLLDEKAALLGDLLELGATAFFVHDPVHAGGRLARDDRGRVVLAEGLRELRLDEGATAFRSGEPSR